ncbi:MAG TPA: hypothetical protein VFN49_07320, partial [Candidatus Aquilonibacter sp.]|nr:hypothetical protein [Candidatus Aquilonibacter sp.]
MPVFIAVTAAAQTAGGLALQFDRWARQGSLVVAIVYIVFALTALPAIAMHPLIYATWGQVLYSLGVVTGAVALYTPTAWRA